MHRIIPSNTDPLRSRPAAIQTSTSGTVPSKKGTQQEQDAADEEARRKATKDLVSAWNDRLQLITVLATFFASTEAGMLQVTTSPGSSPNSYTKLQQATNACFVGALVVHTNAAIFSFLASFMLVQFKVKEAHREERSAGMTTSPGGISDVEKSPKTTQGNGHGSSSPPHAPTGHAAPPSPIFSTNPHLAQVGPFRSTHPPEGILRRCHSLCVFLCASGFILALIGIVCFTWSAYPNGVNIFVTACMGFCVIAGFLSFCPLN